MSKKTEKPFYKRTLTPCLLLASSSACASDRVCARARSRQRVSSGSACSRGASARVRLACACCAPLLSCMSRPCLSACLSVRSLSLSAPSACVRVRASALRVLECVCERLCALRVLECVCASEPSECSNACASASAPSECSNACAPLSLSECSNACASASAPSECSCAGAPLRARVTRASHALVTSLSCTGPRTIPPHWCACECAFGAQDADRCMSVARLCACERVCERWRWGRAYARCRRSAADKLRH